MAMATPCCYGNFYLQKNFISYSMRGYESIFWLVWCFLVFTFKQGRYRHHTKPGQATLNQIEPRSVATCRMKVLRSVSRNYRDGLSGPANVFLRGLNGLNFKLFGQNVSRPIRFAFVGPTKSSPGYIRLNTINNFVVCSCFLLYDGKNRGL